MFLGEPDYSRLDDYQALLAKREADAVRTWGGPVRCECGQLATIVFIAIEQSGWYCPQCKPKDE